MTSEQQKKFKITDDVVVIIREIVQLSLITGTSLVDHLRAVQLVEDANRPGYVTLDEEYVRSYNQYIETLNAEAKRKAEEMQGTEANVEG